MEASDVGLEVGALVIRVGFSQRPPDDDYIAPACGTLEVATIDGSLGSTRIYGLE